MSNEFYLKIPKEVTGRILEFKSIDEFQTWINQERSSLEWVSQVSRNFSNIVWKHISQQFSQTTNQINAIVQNLNNKSPIEGNIGSLEEWFKATYQTKKLILSSSAEFKAVEQTKAKSPLKASVFLGHILGVQNLYANGVETPEMIEASSEYYQYVNGLSNKDLMAEKEALNDLKSNWDIHLDTYKNQEEDLKGQFNSTKTNFETFFAQSQLDLTAHVQKHTDELDELKKTYDQFMALKAPVDYWKNKREHHLGLVSKMKWWAIGIGSLGAIVFTLAVSKVFDDTPPAYWKVAIFILIGTLFFWTLRVLMKLLLSNIHLETDAHEREVMVQTYLSLLREQTGLNDNDKKLILSTLFRPTSSGIVGDDGIPPGIYDVFTKFASK